LLPLGFFAINLLSLEHHRDLSFVLMPDERRAEIIPMKRLHTPYVGLVAGVVGFLVGGVSYLRGSR